MGVVAGGGEQGPVSTVEVMIPDRLVRHVIGNRGAKIDAIEQETGVRIKIPRDEPLIRFGNEECKRVLFTGTAEAVNRARFIAEEAAYRDQGGAPRDAEVRF